MQRFVDSVLGIAKESLKAFSQESFNNTIKLINGISALILAILPGKASILEGVQGWELKPTFRAPRLPRWMEEGVSSFNQLIHEYAADSDADSDSEYGSGADDNDSTAPSSPSSVSSQLSKSSSFWFDKNDSSTFTYGFITKVSDYLKQLLCKSRGRNSSVPGSSRESDFGRRLLRRSSSSGSLYQMYGYASRGFTSVKDLVIHHTTDRRRGIVEDSQLVVELLIERVFDVLRKILLYSLSPFQTLKLLVRKLLSDRKADKETVTIQTATLGDSDPAPSVKRSKLTQAAMNTDARSCEDVITDLGYPYEAIRVVTADGYLLLLERIPRRDSRKVLYFQHGVLDSSLGWVSNGVVGSQAFAAYDQGYDVFLGNFRGLASREHVDKTISAQRYWSYSINEHGTQDIPAMINKLHDLKMEELKSLQIISSDISGLGQPYTLCGVAHSLGGAGMLIYVVTRRLEGKPHRLSRLILLSPAGFHEAAPLFCSLVQYVFPAMAPFLTPLIPGLYIRTKVLRALFNKLARDFQKYPAVGGLVQTLCGYLIGGDSSNWIQALGQTHFNMYDMPGVAYRVVVHLAQMRRCNRFQMYDFGSACANKAVYGTPYPLDIGANYDMIDIPVDFVGGKKDKLIPRDNVKKHYQLLKKKGGRTSYSEFEYAHLDFTFAHHEELLAYVMSRLLLVTPPESSGLVRTARKSKSDIMKSESRRDLKRTRSRRSSRASDQESPTDENGVGMPDIAELAVSPFEDHEKRDGVDGNISTYMNGSD